MVKLEPSSHLNAERTLPYPHVTHQTGETGNVAHPVPMVSPQADRILLLDKEKLGARVRKASALTGCAVNEQHSYRYMNITGEIALFVSTHALKETDWLRLCRFVEEAGSNSPETFIRGPVPQEWELLPIGITVLPPYVTSRELARQIEYTKQRKAGLAHMEKYLPSLIEQMPRIFSGSDYTKTLSDFLPVGQLLNADMSTESDLTDQKLRNIWYVIAQLNDFPHLVRRIAGVSGYSTRARAGLFTQWEKYQ